MLWMAVTADEYELPLAVEKTARELAKRMFSTKSAILKNEKRTRCEAHRRKYTGKRNKFGQPYKVIRVEEK